MRSQNIENMCSGTYVYDLGTHCDRDVQYIEQGEMEKALFTHWFLRGRKSTVWGFVEEEMESEIEFLTGIGARFCEVQNGYHSHGCQYFFIESEPWVDLLRDTVQKKTKIIEDVLLKRKPYILKENMWFLNGEKVFLKAGYTLEPHERYHFKVRDEDDNCILTGCSYDIKCWLVHAKYIDTNELDNISIEGGTF